MNLRNEFFRLRNLTSELVRNLEPEDFVVQPVNFVLPPKWHLAHTTWFLETFILKKFVPNYSPILKEIAFLFQNHHNSSNLSHSRPLVREVMDFRKEIDSRMDALLSSRSDSELYALIELANHHEQYHLEALLSDLKYIWSLTPLKPVFSSEISPKKAYVASSNWFRMEGAMRDIGTSSSSFHLDSESPSHKVYVSSFEISSTPVLVADFLDFIQSRGYERSELWLPEAFRWLRESSITAPLYWNKEGRDYYIYTLNGYRKLTQEEPVVHLNFFEADAYARWKGCRLPTEAEWEISASLHGLSDKSFSFLESGTYHPTSLDVGETSFLGRVWEWTSGVFQPYPGNKVNINVGEYDGKFPTGKYVLRGGSCITSKTHIRTTSRCSLNPYNRVQFTGLRLARSTN